MYYEIKFGISNIIFTFDKIDPVIDKMAKKYS